MSSIPQQAAAPVAIEQRLAELATEMDRSGELDQLLDVVTTSARDLVPGCDAASITLRRGGGKLDSVAPTSPIAQRADDLQYSLGEGPCLHAARTDSESVTVAADVATDARWPTWGPAVAEAEGVRSIVAIQLLSADRVHGALNLFSLTPDAFPDESVAAASVLGVHAGIAVRTCLLDRDLAAAVTSRRLIGQAQGLLMERFGLDTESSFALLNRMSQTSNVKLQEVARRLVAERRRGGSVADGRDRP